MIINKQINRLKRREAQQLGIPPRCVTDPNCQVTIDRNVRGAFPVQQ